MNYPSNEKVGIALSEVDRHLRDEFLVEAPGVADILKHALSGGGKRLRPTIFLASTALLGGELENVVDLAAAVEMIHTASLLHDDVLDSASLRRGKPALRDFFGDKASILAGDLIWCRASHIFVGRDIKDLAAMATDLVISMTRGQLLELRHLGDSALERAGYLETIELKTATLFSFSASSPSILLDGGASMKALSAYGHGIGMAFQLIDDAMDYASDEANLGKPCMADLRDGKATYPFILAMERVDSGLCDLLKDALQSKKRLAPSSLVDRARGIIIDSGAVEDTYRLAVQFVREAKEALSPFEDNEFKHFLIDMADFIVETRN